MSIDLLSEAFLNRISEKLFVDYSTILGLLRWKTSSFFFNGRQPHFFYNMDEDPSFSKMGDYLIFFNGRQFQTLQK